jgi:hypothetical protein
MINQVGKYIIGAGIVFGLMCVAGCTLNGQPRARLGSYATSTPGTNFLGPDNLGEHNYENALSEGNGIVYTCRGGHIDIAHLRINADYTRYLYHLTCEKLWDDRTHFTFKLNVEPSVYTVTLKYPPRWYLVTLKEKQKLIPQVALELSQYLTFTMSTWHEILTFYGYKCMAVLPEEPSAFSWEDIYSNLVGIRLGAKALQYSEDTYNQAMTKLLQEELVNLKIQSRDTAWYAAEKMRNKWFEGTVLIKMVQRNMDIGLDDGFVTPVLVPDICQGEKPVSYPVPKLDMFNRLGFSMILEVRPAEFEKNSILKIIYPSGGGSTIRFPDDWPKIMDYTKAEAIKRGCKPLPDGK